MITPPVRQVATKLCGFYHGIQDANGKNIWVQDINDLLAKNAALRDMLKKHQFACIDQDDNYGYYCPECGGSGKKNEHRPLCALAKLLKEG